MNENVFIGGAKLSLPDARDYKVKSNADGKFPHSKELILWTPKTERNQGRTANCVAQALAVWYATYYFEKEYAAECLKRENLTREDFQKEYSEKLASVGAIYGNRRLDRGDDTAGLFVRNALKHIQKYGDCPSSVWDSNAEVKDIILMFEYHYPSFESSLETIKEYVSISSKDEAMYFMDNYKLPLIVVTDSKLYNPLSSGYHAVCAYAYRDVGEGLFTVNNSWGNVDDHLEIEFSQFKEVWGVIPHEYIEFSDVPKEHWAYKSIIECVKKGLMKGFPDGSFAPDEPLTRAQMAQILYRLGE